MSNKHNSINNKAGHQRGGGKTPRTAQQQSWRGDKRTAQQRGYTHRWQKAARLYLDEHPLCVLCMSHGHTAGATVVDHITPHKGNQELFWSIDNWQALCKPCHDSEKKEIENQGFSTTIGNDGWPVDPAHPVNKHGKKPNNIKGIGGVLQK